MNVRLETDRLLLREFTEDDAAMLFHMHQDPEITQYLGDKIPWSDTESARQILKSLILPQYPNGIGRWAVHLKSNGTFLGWCGIRKVDDCFDIGYRFLKMHWNKGYATESASAVLQYAKMMKLHPVYGIADARNLASIRVFEKIGLTFKENYLDDSVPPIPSVRYEYIYH